MKSHALLVIFEKAENLKLPSAANYRWRFKGLISKDFSRKPSIFKYFSSLCTPCLTYSFTHLIAIISSFKLTEYFITENLKKKKSITDLAFF